MRKARILGTRIPELIQQPEVAERLGKSKPTLADLARASGCDPANMFRIAKGRQNPTGRYYEDIPRALGRRPSEVWVLAD